MISQRRQHRVRPCPERDSWAWVAIRLSAAGVLVGSVGALVGFVGEPLRSNGYGIGIMIGFAAAALTRLPTTRARRTGEGGGGRNPGMAIFRIGSDFVGVLMPARGDVEDHTRPKWLS